MTNKYKKQCLFALLSLSIGLFTGNAVASERDDRRKRDRPIFCPDGNAMGAWANPYGFILEGNPLFAPALYVLIGIEENDSQETFEKKVQIWNEKQAIEEHRERGRSQIQDWTKEGIQKQQEKEEYFQKRAENFDKLYRFATEGDFDWIDDDLIVVVDELPAGYIDEFDKKWNGLALDDFLEKLKLADAKPFLLSVEAKPYKPSVYKGY